MVLWPRADFSLRMRLPKLASLSLNLPPPKEGAIHLMSPKPPLECQAGHGARGIVGHGQCEAASR